MRVLALIPEPARAAAIVQAVDRLTGMLRDHKHAVDITSIDNLPLSMARLAEIFEPYALVHWHIDSFSLREVSLLWLLNRLGKARPSLVVTLHHPADLSHLHLTPWRLPVDRLTDWLGKLADHVVVTTPAYARYLAGAIPDAKVSTIPWGATPPPAMVDLADRPGNFAVTYRGPLELDPGLRTLINAMASLEGVRLVLIGDTAAGEEVRRHISDVGLPEVVFTDISNVDRLTDAFAGAQALLLPDRPSAAVNLNLLDGMAAGCVPIAWRDPATQDFVGSEGFQIASGDSQALREALVRLRNDRAYRLYMSKLARERARLYTWQRTAYEYERIVDGLTSRTAVPVHLGQGAAVVPVHADDFSSWTVHRE